MKLNFWSKTEKASSKLKLIFIYYILPHKKKFYKKYIFNGD